MRLIVNSTNRFNNPKLPSIASPGFLDVFSRPAANTPGATSREGRDWMAFTNSATVPMVWATTGNGELEFKEGAGRNILVADAMASSGVLRATVTLTKPSGNVGLAFRVRDLDNMYYLAQITEGGGLRVQKRVGGVETSRSSSSYVPKTTGEVYQVTLAGAAISVAVNGATIMTFDDPTFQDEEVHGLFAARAAMPTRFSQVSFTPA